MKISLTVNGEAQELDVPENTLLVEIIRERLGLTGTHVGCDTSQCGACTVHMDGVAVKSCSRCWRAQVDGAESDHHRRHRHAWTRCIPMQAAFQGVPRAPVWLLHARDDHARH